MTGPVTSDDAQDPTALLRDPAYIALLVMGALIGVPVAAAAASFMRVVDLAQDWLYVDLPDALGFDGAPTWWPIPVMALGALLVALVIVRLPGTGGHEPSAGLVSTGAPARAELPGIVLAALFTLSFGGVVGPEAPLIALGAGIALLIVGAIKRDAPEQALVVLGAAGSFAAISTLLGSPLLGAFLLMEVAGIAGPMIGVVFLPGLVAAGIGALVFVGIDGLTGWGTFSLAIPDLPTFSGLTGAQFLWAIAIGLGAGVLGTAIRAGAGRLQPVVAARRIPVTVACGIGVGVAAVAFDLATDRGADQVLFSGEDALAPLVQQASTWTVGALLALIAAKGVAYVLSLASLRGGPTFPAMLIGAAGGLALSHLPGLPPVAGVAMGIGAMAVVMLRLPLTSVLLTSLFVQSAAVELMPLVIVAVAVAHVAAARAEFRLLPAAATAG